MKTIDLIALHPFYLGYRTKETFRAGDELRVTVTCGCDGTMIPGNVFRMGLCPLHEAKAVREGFKVDGS